MSLFVSPVVRATDANGKNLPGAVWAFYTTGTTSPQSVYSDVTLATPLGTSVTADSGGLFEDIYLDPAIDYRAILKDALGTVIADIDPVPNQAGEFAASTGSSLIGYIQGGTGSVYRSVQGRLRDRVSIRDFGAVGDGTTDDTSAIQAALDSLGSAGGTVYVPDGMTPLVDSNLNLPANCCLIADTTMLARTFNAPNLNLFKPHIILNRAATVTLNDSSEFSVPVFAKALTFSDTSAHVNAWTGTAITLADNTADHYIHDCLILGFALGISTGANTRVDRVRIDRVQIDCVGGIYIKNAFDVVYINDCHGWPWTTLDSGVEANNAHLKRAGAFIQLDGTTNDAAKITDCFNYGWKYGFRMTSADSYTLLNCGADNPPGASDASIGFLIESASFEGRMIGCQSSGRQEGVKIDTTDTNGRVFLLGCNVWATVDHAVHIVRGDISIIGGGLRNTGPTGNGVYFEDTGTKLRMIGVKLNGFAIGVKTDSVGAIVVHDLCDFSGCTTNVNNPYILSLASANPLVLDGTSTFVDVQGATNFSTINDAKVYAGKAITLKFNGALFVGTGGNLKLNGGSSFSTTADDTITFRSNGTNWYEVSRSANA